MYSIILCGPAGKHLPSFSWLKGSNTIKQGEWRHVIFLLDLCRGLKCTTAEILEHTACTDYPSNPACLETNTQNKSREVIRKGTMALHASLFIIPLSQSMEFAFI